MAVQFAKEMGYRVIAISRGRAKEESIRKLGAHEYIDSTDGDAGEALVKLGLANLVLTTAMDTKAMEPLLKGIGRFGKMMIVSMPEDPNLTVNVHGMLMRGVSVQAWPVSSCHDCQKTVEFAELAGVDCDIEIFPLEKAQEAFGMYCTSISLRSSLLTTDGRRNVSW
jgi:D-arabinose 1-dehydrogenase-like Zn-dependent alcohol dehydrogenase